MVFDRRLSSAMSDSVRLCMASKTVKKTVKRNTTRARRGVDKAIIDSELAQYCDEIEERLKAAQERVKFEELIDSDDEFDAELAFENYLQSINDRRAKRRLILQELEANLG